MSKIIEIGSAIKVITGIMIKNSELALFSSLFQTIRLIIFT